MSTIKKILAILLSAVLCLAAFTALAESSETPVTINFWHHYSAQSAENETLMNDLIPKFESENPGIKVNAVSHEWAELHDKILVSASSQSLPDVARCDIAWLPEFQKMGVLVALDEAMPDFADVSAALLDSAMSTAKIGGHYYALALNTNSKILFYNTAMLEAANVAVPTTMDEWVAAVRALSGANANGQQVWGWNEPALSGWNICPFIWSFGGSLTNADRGDRLHQFRSDRQGGGYLCCAGEGRRSDRLQQRRHPHDRRLRHRPLRHDAGRPLEDRRAFRRVS